MKINTTNDKVTVMRSEIPYGELYEFEGYVYMKVRGDVNGNFTDYAVNVDAGMAHKWADGEAKQVIPVKAHIQLEDG